MPVATKIMESQKGKNNNRDRKKLVNETGRLRNVTKSYTYFARAARALFELNAAAVYSDAFWDKNVIFFVPKKRKKCWIRTFTCRLIFL